MNTHDIETTRKWLQQQPVISIIPHKNPDGDAIGSCLGLCLYLRQLQLNATVVSPNDFPEFLKWLPAVDDIIIYDNDQERAKAQIEVSTLIFTLDFNSLKRADSLSGLLEKQTAATFVMIDHHQAPEDYAQVTFSDPSASSTCEMVYRFIEAVGDKALINRDIATCLYTGLMTDTGNFKYPTTTSNTLRIGAFLIDQGANNSQINSLVFDTNSYNKLQLLSVALRNLVYVEEWNTAYITLTSEELQQHNHQKGDTEGFVNYGLTIKNTRLAVIFIQEGDYVKMSLRSKGTTDVNRFAREHFNGGGHINAAGGRYDGTIEE
uniref:DHH family phosphoesterase n=1 Tax=Capnocytophaga leadbetteri TaxID=327575 RepID=UPI003C6F503E